MRMSDCRQSIDDNDRRVDEIGVALRTRSESQRTDKGSNESGMEVVVVVILEDLNWTVRVRRHL